MDHAAAVPGGDIGVPAKESDAGFYRARLGMWMFLASEIMMFGAFIACYIVLRIANPNVFRPEYLHEHLSWKIGLFNTFVLILSSFTMVMAVHYIRKNKPSVSGLLIAITATLGIVFLVVKLLFEYAEDFGHGIYPNTSVFWGCYFLLTGFHGIHVLCGVIYLFALLPCMVSCHHCGTPRFNSERHAHIELGGLYWHLVDVIWIFIFPLLYLIPITK